MEAWRKGGLVEMVCDDRSGCVRNKHPQTFIFSVTSGVNIARENVSEIAHILLVGDAADNHRSGQWVKYIASTCICDFLTSFSFICLVAMRLFCLRW